MKITITKNQTTISIECEASDNPDIIVGKIIQAMEKEVIIASADDIKGRPYLGGILSQMFPVTPEKIMPFSGKDFFKNQYHPATCDCSGKNCERTKLNNGFGGELIDEGSFLVCPCGEYKQTTNCPVKDASTYTNA